MRWPFCSKYLRKEKRISFEVISIIEPRTTQRTQESRATLPLKADTTYVVWLQPDLIVRSVRPFDAHPEPFDSPLILSLSKDERLAQDRPVEG